MCSALPLPASRDEACCCEAEQRDRPRLGHRDLTANLTTTELHRVEVDVRV